MKKLLVGLVSAGFSLTNAGAALLFYDGFEYTPPGTFLAPVTDTTASPNPGLLNAFFRLELAICRRRQPHLE
jgi:hypothetical protein